MSDEIEQQAAQVPEFSDELSDEALDRQTAGGTLPICMFCWNE
jgi:hypothetical protein